MVGKTVECFPHRSKSDVYLILPACIPYQLRGLRALKNLLWHFKKPKLCKRGLRERANLTLFLTLYWSSVYNSYVGDNASFQSLNCCIWEINSENWTICCPNQTIRRYITFSWRYDQFFTDGEWPLKDADALRGPEVGALSRFIFAELVDGCRAQSTQLLLCVFDE